MGDDKTGCTAFNIAPWSEPVRANFAVIAPGLGGFTPLDVNGAVIRCGSGGTLVNGIIARWPGRALNIRDGVSLNALTLDSLIIAKLVLTDNGVNFDPETETISAVMVITNS